MATIRGEQGAVQFEAAGGSKATIVGTRSWSLSTTKETLDVSKHGDSFRSFVGSMISGSGTVELVYDPDATGQAGFLEDVLTTADPADAKHLYADLLAWVAPSDDVNATRRLPPFRKACDQSSRRTT